MSEDRLYPQNFDELLSKFQLRFHEAIHREYNRLYDERIGTIMERVKADLDEAINNYDDHRALLSAALIPFIEKKVENFEFLFEGIFE